MSPHKLPTHFRANDVICSLLLRATQTCRRTCGQCERTRQQVEPQVRPLVSESFHTSNKLSNLCGNMCGNMWPVWKHYYGLTLWIYWWSSVRRIVDICRTFFWNFFHYTRLLSFSMIDATVVDVCRQVFTAEGKNLTSSIRINWHKWWETDPRLTLFQICCSGSSGDERAIINNKSSSESFGNSRVATPHCREWTRQLRVLDVQCPLQTSPITQPLVGLRCMQSIPQAVFFANNFNLYINSHEKKSISYI